MHRTDLKKYRFTSESVSEGHPDKICDQLSDVILDAYLKLDPEARVAVETMAIPNKIIIAGEVRGPELSGKKLDELVRGRIKEIGYDNGRFSWQDLAIEYQLNEQSADIALGVDKTDSKDEGAGDQGLMFGFAIGETEDLMPAPIFYAHKILKNISEARKKGEIKGLGPDAKSQVTLNYVDGMPQSVSNLLVSIQHHPDLTQEQVRELVYPYVVAAFPNKDWMCADDKFLVNPTGRFVVGGPESDTGLTGRKIIVDTYGGAAPHGGGAFSGKDPTKVDRSAAYMARYLAKNIVAAGLAHRCTIQLAYAIGVANPLSFYINTHRTGLLPESKLIKILEEMVDLRPRAIRERLQLNNPIYAETATYGHFGRKFSDKGHFTWEKTDLAANLKNYLP